MMKGRTGMSYLEWRDRRMMMHFERLSEACELLLLPTLISDTLFDLKFT